MSDCINCINDDYDTNYNLYYNSSEWLIYWQLAANFSAICTLFSVCIVCYFLIAREHPSRPDETDKIEIDRFNNSFNLINKNNKTSLISDLGVYIWFKNKWKLLKHRLFIALFDDPLNDNQLNDINSNYINNESTNILIDNNLNSKQNINNKKNGFFNKFKRNTNNNNNNNNYNEDDDDDGDNYDEDNESNMSIELIKDFKYNFKQKQLNNKYLSLSSSSLNYNNKIYNIDAHVNLSYLKLFNSILIVFTSIINNTYYS
jgi:hypothetical protein